MRLAVAAKEDTPTGKHEEMLPKPYLGFWDVFSKESFNELPEWKQWDYAIDLKPESQSFSMKVYLMSLIEQKELNDFLEENLLSGRPPLEVPDGVPSLLHEEERWETMVCPRLPKAQCDDSKEHLPATYWTLSTRFQTPRPDT